METLYQTPPERSEDLIDQYNDILVYITSQKPVVIEYNNVMFVYQSVYELYPILNQRLRKFMETPATNRRLRNSLAIDLTMLIFCNLDLVMQIPDYDLECISLFCDTSVPIFNTDSSTVRAEYMRQCLNLRRIQNLLS